MTDPALIAAAEVIGKLKGEERKRALLQLQLLIPADPEAATNDAPEVHTLREYMAIDFPDPPSIIEPALVVRGELTFTIGRAGKGKTTMNQHRLLRWSAGLPMFDALPHVNAPKDGKPARILVIENEGAAAFFQAKMRTMLDAEEYLPGDARAQAGDNLLIWGSGGYAGWRVDDLEAYDHLRRQLDAHRPDVLFVEPFRTLFRGDENDADVVSTVLDRFSLLATEFDVAIMVAHHERKSGAGDSRDWMAAARGSTALEGHVAVMENFIAYEDEDLRELRYSKSRYMPAPPAIRMRWDRNSGFYDYVPEDAELEPVLQYLKGLEGAPGYVADVAEALAITPDRARELLNRSVQAKRVHRGQSLPGTNKIPYTLIEDDDQTGGLKF